jgi:anti-anti-sigma regulatory factor
MRTHGFANTAAGLLPFGHMGWAYHSRDEFLTRAAEYLLDGLNNGQRVAFVAEETTDVLRAELAAIPQLRDHPHFDDIEVLSAAGYYPFHEGTDVIDPAVAIARYLDAADTAIRDGYNGFRAAVDVTSVARSTEQRDELTALEYLVDQLMAVRPFSALCAYDVGELGAEAGEVLCLHPFFGPHTSEFHIFADEDPAVDCVLSGELDQSSAQVFTSALRRILPLTPAGTVRIDAQGLQFISHRQLLQLNELAREHERTIVLVTSQGVPMRLVELLQPSHVRVLPPGDAVR